LYKANPREQPQYLYPGPSSVWDPHPDLTPEQIAIYNEYAAKFYKEGTLQSSWRSLYNDFCKAAATVRKDDKYGSHDTRFIKWTREDTEDASFRITPDTLPT
jgi:hypothetical protein